MLKSILRSLTTFDKVVLIVICLIMANNVEHLAWVHYSIARHSLGTIIFNKAHSIAVVLIVELSIIVMVFKGEEFYAGLYTFFLLALSLIYYPLHKYWISGQWENFTAAVIYSCMFTLSIWYFARMAAKRQQVAAETEQNAAKYYEAARDLAATKRTVNDLQQQLQQNGNKQQQIAADKTEAARTIQQLEKELNELRLFRQQTITACTCKHCSQQFESEASKRSHEGRCSSKEMKKVA